jgi:hypothetical protein
MFNPLKYTYNATLVEQNADEATVELRLGAKVSQIKIPPEFLPPEVEIGESFLLRLKPIESDRESDYETMRKLLKSLIN